jgi:hypothetical protein
MISLINTSIAFILRKKINKTIHETIISYISVDFIKINLFSVETRNKIQCSGKI